MHGISITQMQAKVRIITHLVESSDVLHEESTQRDIIK